MRVIPPARPPQMDDSQPQLSMERGHNDVGDEVDDHGEKGAEEKQQWNRRDNAGARPE